MRNSMILLASAALFACCTGSQETTVHLKGQLIDMGSNQVTFMYDGAEELVGNSKDIHIQTDTAGNFDTIVTLKEPAFFRISRNTVYLTPGDDLTMKITPNNEEAEFSGKGSEANNYMKYRLFPKGGSYLEAGGNIRATYDETKQLIDSLSKARLAQLEALENVSSEFKELERARVMADIANSYLCYPSYASYALRKNGLSADECKAYIDSVLPSVYSDILPYCKELNQDKLMDVAVVRDVMNAIVEPYNDELKKAAKNFTVSPYMKELYAAAGYVNKLRGKLSEEVFNEVNTFINGMQNQELILELKAKLDQASKLMKGRPAIDFEMKDKDGNVHHLSDFKGKIIYLDFWATWCGPCIQESPYFEKLAKEFEGKDILFIPVSTDKDKAAWTDFITAHKKELPQYNSIDEKLVAEWAIHYIPRFVIIDKDFNIVDAYAPVPSSPEAKQLLETLIK